MPSCLRRWSLSLSDHDEKNGPRLGKLPSPSVPPQTKSSDVHSWPRFLPTLEHDPPLLDMLPSSCAGSVMQCDSHGRGHGDGHAYSQRPASYTACGMESFNHPLNGRESKLSRFTWLRDALADNSEQEPRLPSSRNMRCLAEASLVLFAVILGHNLREITSYTTSKRSMSTKKNVAAQVSLSLEFCSPGEEATNMF